MRAKKLPAIDITKKYVKCQMVWFNKLKGYGEGYTKNGLSLMVFSTENLQIGNEYTVKVLNERFLGTPMAILKGGDL